MPPLPPNNTVDWTTAIEHCRSYSAYETALRTYRLLGHAEPLKAMVQQHEMDCYVARELRVPRPESFTDWAECQFIRAASDEDMALLESLVAFDLDRLCYRPLPTLCRYGWARGVQLLVDRGCAPDQADQDNDTPLHYAAAGGHIEVARILIAAGAKASVRNRLGSTPVHCYATAAASEQVAQEMLALLLANGGDVNARCHDGATPLDVAVSHRCLFEEIALRKHEGYRRG